MYHFADLLAQFVPVYFFLFFEFLAFPNTKWITIHLNRPDNTRGLFLQKILDSPITFIIRDLDSHSDAAVFDTEG